MVDWVLNTSLSIALNAERKRTLSSCNRQPITSLRRPLKVLEERHWKVGSRRPWDVKLETSPRRQMGTSLGWLSKKFSGHSGDAGSDLSIFVVILSRLIQNQNK